MRWEVAKDRRFRKVVRQGTFRTGPSRDHTVKLVVGGLKPETWYYYRFHLHKHTSRVGRTRTAPLVNSTPDHVRLGVVSCANLQAGWFSAYRGLVKRDDLHAIVHLGDYLYEYGAGPVRLRPGRRRHPVRTSPRTRWSRCPTTGSGTRSTSRTRTSRTCTRSTRG